MNEKKNENFKAILSDKRSLKIYKRFLRDTKRLDPFRVKKNIVRLYDEDKKRNKVKDYTKW